MSGRSITFAALLFAITTTAAAATAENACMAMSEYEFQVTNDQVIAMSESRVPHAVVMKDGRLFVANQWVTLTKDDTQRVRSIEKSLRALEPRIQAENERAGREQFRAFRQIANQSAADNNPSDPVAVWREQMKRNRAERRFRIGPMSAWQARGGDRVMEGMADSMMGMMGELLREFQAMRRTGNADGIETIFSKMPMSNIPNIVPTALCREYQALNEQDNALTFRHNGEPLELLRVMEPNFR